MINAQTLALCKPSAFIINTARGALIDEPALLTVLQQHRIAGAALDGLTQEPPALDNPLMKAAKIMHKSLINMNIS
ncbi:MAG: NAD(P)-dependent oxidoreductase [Symbiopectobacterium sp.]|uniref:NAD(P)-dependent oxidoreductase n=1 Tax=Symbiopectobacterium sp. TaxID=2952789 RepID=UPI0039E907C1